MKKEWGIFKFDCVGIGFLQPDSINSLSYGFETKNDALEGLKVLLLNDKPNCLGQIGKYIILPYYSKEDKCENSKSETES